jgi:Putative endonuclease segE, GIY-YIG domain
MTWYYDGVPFDDDGTSFGFVYLIENLITGKKYIGRKYFSKAGYKQVNGKRKKIRKTSDWETYYGSNETLKREVAEIGAHNFRRTILHLCKTRSECSYWETFEIFSRHALLDESFYNDWVSAKIRKAHLKSIVQSNIK